MLVSITNCNSPLVWDATMLDAMKVYARHNQPLILAPFALCGASTSASAVGAVAQVNAEALAGVAFTQLLRPGSPQIYGQFMVTVDMKTGAPMGGTPEAAQMMYLMGALARKYRLPWRTSGFHVGSKLNDAQAGYEANMLMHAAILSGANYIWHVGRLARGGPVLRLFEIRDRREQLVGWYKYARRPVRSTISRRPWRRSARSGPQGHFLGTQHTLEHFEKAFFIPSSWISIPSSNGRPKARRIRHARPRQGKNPPRQLRAPTPRPGHRRSPHRLHNPPRTRAARQRALMRPPFSLLPGLRRRREKGVIGAPHFPFSPAFDGEKVPRRGG